MSPVWLHRPRKRRWPAILASASLVVALSSGCSPAPRDCARPDVFCGGLVTDFGSTDDGVAGQAWLALKDAAAAGMVDRVDRIETVDSRDRAANISAFVDSGYDFIVTVGGAIASETATAAMQHPTSHFIGVGQSQPVELPNLVVLVFHEEQSGFLAGSLAALVSRTGRLAAICEARFIDAMRRYCDGFQAGALFARPDIQVAVVYRDGSQELLFHDALWARTAATAQIDQGADVIFAAGGDTADAALETAAAAGALVIGSETDAYERLVPIQRQVLTSAISQVRSGLLDVLRLARAEQLPRGEYFGTVGLAPFHDLQGTVPAGAAAMVDAIQQQMTDGTIHLDIPYRSP